MNFIDVLNDSKFILIYVIMVKEFFQNEVNVLCDSTTSDVCGTRDQNIIDWTNLYTGKKNTYLQALKAWLESKIDSTVSTNDSSLQTNVESAYNDLMIHLNELSDYNNRIAESISTSASAIRTNQNNIRQNNSTITHQDNDIKKLNISLLSKKRQIEFTMERNRNRRIMIAILIIINLILIGVTYFLYTKK